MNYGLHDGPRARAGCPCWVSGSVKQTVLSCARSDRIPLANPEQRRKRDIIGLRARTTLSLFCESPSFIGTNWLSLVNTDHVTSGTK